MSKVPGVIRRRGAGWNVLVRVDGHRHEYGPRSVPLLRHGSREEVEEWVWAEYRRLVREARTEASGDIRFSELVQRWRDEELSALNPGGAHAYEDSLKPIEEYFVERKEDPPIRNIRPADIKQFLAWRRTARRVRASEVRQRRRRPHKSAAPKPLSPHTVAKDRRGLHRLFEYAHALDVGDRQAFLEAYAALLAVNARPGYETRSRARDADTASGIRSTRLIGASRQ